MSEPVVETQDLAVRFGGVHAVNHVNFSLRERELRCLIGPNGAGKSTFFKWITGQIRSANSSGRVFIRGQDVTGWATRQIVRLGVGIKTQVPSVMNGLTVLGKPVAVGPAHRRARRRRRRGRGGRRRA